MKFDRDFWRESLKKMPGLSGEDLEHALDHMQEQEKNLKYGENVLTFAYQGNVISESEVVEFEKLMNEHGFQLGYMDDSKSIKASFYDQLNRFVIDNAFLALIISSFVLQPAYELLKRFVISLYDKAIGKNVPVAFDFRFRAGYLLTFIFDPKVKKEVIEDALNNLPKSVRTFSKDESDKTVNKHESYILSKKGNWKLYDINKEIIKREKKQVKRKKKALIRKK